MRSKPTTTTLVDMHPHLHTQLARAIIAERLREADERHQARQARQPSGRRARRLTRTVTRGNPVYDRSRVIARTESNQLATHTTKGQP